LIGAPLAGAAQAVPGEVIAPLTGAAALAAEFLPQPTLAAPGAGGGGGLFAMPALNLPAVSGFGVPLPTQISLPQDMVCAGPTWSAAARPNDPLAAMAPTLPSGRDDW
jgi:hypothetical protein